jgi:hypothetical protein
MDDVAGKMVADFDDIDPRSVPSCFSHLGDVVYSFGEGEYYYDQSYDPFRNYSAPIFAIAGNYDGMVAPKSDATSLAAFLENFCQAGKPFHCTPESGALARTAQLLPGVYYTLSFLCSNPCPLQQLSRRSLCYIHAKWAISLPHRRATGLSHRGPHSREAGSTLALC